MKKISGMRSVDSTEAIAVMHMPKHFCDLNGDEGGAGLDELFHQSPNRILVLDGIQVKISDIQQLFRGNHSNFA
jgi:TrmH family RNA methyltransferase